ncbi:hypothetical protein [Actinopolymorpha pittospori]|uniref:Uncharacterized protein n=1 Tax=Actinopolymorpha pittospori TaxID=648752 RepID=A0A927MTZ7_9ACTN|nr:hypothetical protein [Actinopolymorpha pittospori]MBE1606277.1 hypothetical protein [Actinopolymorpha pittospori]
MSALFSGVATIGYTSGTSLTVRSAASCRIGRISSATVAVAGSASVATWIAVWTNRLTMLWSVTSTSGMR